MNWKSLEEHVRGVAALKWSKPCIAEHIDGVDFDGVVRVSPDEVIIIEITKEKNLDKVRRDINKIFPTKVKLATQGMICRAFIIISEEPTESMKEAGRAQHIQVCSVKTFEKDFFDFDSYKTLRSSLPFGSAVDSKTGSNDHRGFISVSYISEEGDKYNIASLSNELIEGKVVVLTGDYGTGKSRCVSEVFNYLSERILEAGAFPAAINLRDHWSSSNALEILAGHLGNVGLSSSVDNMVRLMNAGNLILLLDGFDEIGTQTYDYHNPDRKALRNKAVQGLRDLIQKNKAGVLITGRSHFFDSTDEMLQSLGLSGRIASTSILSAPESFTPDEGNKYFKSLGFNVSIPSWLPRKPLIFQMLVELDSSDVESILSKEYGQFEFWGTFINAVCNRESKGVSGSISAYSIHLILLELARTTRYSDNFLGRLSPSDIDSAYSKVVGSVPDQNGRQLLSRMCTLGRVEPESPDRQFIDANVIDVLRAESLVSDVITMTNFNPYEQWKQSLRLLGVVYLANYINSFDLEQLSFSYLNKFGGDRNSKKISEILSALTLFGNGDLDFKGLQIHDGVFPVLSFQNREIFNLTIKSSYVNLLIVNNTSTKGVNAVVISDCLIDIVSGVSSASGLPRWINNCDVDSFEVVSNAARIKESSLSSSQKLFLSIVQKIFFQPGSGREESALLKGGYGQKYSPKLVDSILKILLRDGLIKKSKGDNGYVYIPVRKYTERMNRIKSELTLSSDSIWDEITGLSSHD